LLQSFFVAQLPPRKEMGFEIFLMLRAVGLVCRDKLRIVVVEFAFNLNGTAIRLSRPFAKRSSH
jgi:hypothetical protein